MTEENAGETEETVKKRRGCLGWLWRVSVVCFLLIVALLIWLNGPGIRWLGPKVAEHFIQKAGMDGSLELGGTLLGGLDIYDLDISSTEGALERVVVDRLETDYAFSEVIKGKVRGISGQGIHVDMRQIAKEKEDTPPPDFAQIGETLKMVREKILPLSLDIRDVTFSMTKEGERLVSLDSTDLTHVAGADLIALDLGKVTGPDGQEVPAQEVEILWDERQLTLNKLDILPIAGIRDLVVLLPENGALEATVDVRLDGGEFKIAVGAGIKDVRVDLVEGGVDFAEVMSGVGLEIPVEGRLTSLAVDVKGIFPEWQAAEGTVELFVENVAYDGWDVSEASLGLKISEGDYGIKLAGQALDSEFEISGDGKFERSALETEGFVTDGIAGNVNVASVDKLLQALDSKLDLGARFSDFPKSNLGGDWNVKLADGMFAAAGADLTLKASEVEASPIRLKAEYEGKVIRILGLDTTGLSLEGRYDLETKSYVATQTLKDFDSATIEPWLKGAGVVLPGSGIVSMEWKGKGDLFNNRHQGQLASFEAEWKWDEVEGGATKAPISAKGSAAYDWPGEASVDGLIVETEGQEITLDAQLADNELLLESFLWKEGETELASGTGKLPVPEDFSKFKEFLADDSRPLDLTITSEKIPLSRLKPWVQGIEKIDPKATGKIDLKISGSLAAPEVDASLEIRDIGVPDEPRIPTTDVTVKMTARDGRANISAQALAKDYAPAVLEAEMPFLPEKWAEDPDSLKAEEISGVLDLPRIDLSRFQSLIPGAAELGGVAEGKMTIGGTVGDPDIDADLKLVGGKFRSDVDSIPGLSGMDLEIESNLENITIKGGVSNVEGGSLTLNGTLGLKSETGEGLGDLDVSLKATGMPVVRNEFIIVRANVDISIQGPMSSANVTGEVGIIDSVFYKDMDLIPIGKPFLEPSAASLPSVDTPSNPGSTVPAPFSDWTANVVVKTIDPILIRGNLGKGQVDVALRIEGKLGDPKPNGTVRLADATARLPFSTLEIQEGFLRFTPQTGFDPILEIRGTAEPRPYRVSVFAYGRASDPQLVLTSQPPLPENEIMTLLATGTTSSGLEDSQAATSRAMQLLIEELRRGRFLFGKQLRPVLGLLDNVDFSLSEADPYDSSVYNSATLKLNDKWYISAGIGAEGDQRVLAIWRLRFK